MDESLLKLKAVLAKTSLSKATVHRYVKAGTFPKPIQVTPTRVAWRQSEVDAWIAERIAGSATETAAVDAAARSALASKASKAAKASKVATAG